jgi:UPF0176 protein
MSLLVNRIDKKILKQRLKEDATPRKTISFYRYVRISEPAVLRDRLFSAWSALGVMGRIYLAHEGINAQMSVPEAHWDEFLSDLHHRKGFENIPVKQAVDGNGKSFYKLVIKVRPKIVADGITDPAFDPSNTGAYLNARQFNEAIDDERTIVVDMRNHYESEVGRFDRSFCPDADTFREELPLVVDHLKGKEDRKIIMYCTGGIRCEKASAWLKHEGFTDVHHLHGGIIQYAREVKEQGLESRFRGVNFVFDERVGERITADVISTCHQCGQPCDTHVNCHNDDCHLLFIQCHACAERMNGCCTPECMKIVSLPAEEQRRLRKGRIKNGDESLSVYKSRLRPDLKKIIEGSKKSQT